MEKALGIIEKDKEEDLDDIKNYYLIFLSDGRTNDGLDPEALLSIYPERARKNNVRIDAIGFGIIEDEIDRNLLKGLAENTGGQYRFSRTLNELSLSFLVGGHELIGNRILAESQGVIGQDEELEVGEFSTDYYTKDLLITLNWGGSELDLRLVGENGDLVSEGEYTIEKTETLILVNMKNPSKGNYRLVAYGKEVPEGELDYNLVISENRGEFRYGDFIKDKLIYIVVALLVLTILVVVLVRKKGKK